MAGDRTNKDYLQSLRASFYIEPLYLHLYCAHARYGISIAHGEKLKKRCFHYFLSVFTPV